MSRVVAIDGPSASGKSTVAKAVAKKLGFMYVDSGAMYRGVTWLVLQSGLDCTDEDAVKSVIASAVWAFSQGNGEVCYTLNGDDPGAAIRGEAVRENVSYVARVPEVRSKIVEQIRHMESLGGLTIDGRDIGTVVFPRARCKVFLDADPAVRAQRRSLELVDSEGESNVQDVLTSLKKRDEIDSNRETAPLKPAEDAWVLDTTDLSLERVVEEVYLRAVQQLGEA